MRWNPTDAFYHPGEHKEYLYCEDDPQCLWIVEQHQFPKGPEVPEFTISLKWQPGDETAGIFDVKPSRKRGWRWILRWTDPASGETRVRTGYGFGTEQQARNAAELKAIEIAKAQQPEKVYKFTPEV